MMFYERASGARMHANWFRPGGVHQDVPPQLLTDISAWLEQSEEIFEDAIRIVADNRIFKLRNVDISPVGKNDAIRWAFSGPMLRASGVGWDLRQSKRSEAQRVGKEGASKCRSRWGPKDE